MERGGKSVAIVHHDQDLERAAASVAVGLFTPAHQTCPAGSRFIVHRSLHDDHVERVLAPASARTIGSGVEGCDMCPLISARQLGRVEAFCEAGRAERAAVVLGGRRISSPETFRQARDFAAWLGMPPRQHATGGKQRVGFPTKTGERSLRRLLNIGASSVIIKRHVHAAAAPGTWLGGV